MISYNPWNTREKINESQQQCQICLFWDHFYYEALNKIENKKIIVCFNCFHEHIGNGKFEEI
jgi:hypothetical protein